MGGLVHQARPSPSLLHQVGWRDPIRLGGETASGWVARPHQVGWRDPIRLGGLVHRDTTGPHQGKPTSIPPNPPHRREGQPTPVLPGAEPVPSRAEPCRAVKSRAEPCPAQSSISGWTIPCQLDHSLSAGPFLVSWTIPRQLDHSLSAGPLLVSWTIPCQLDHCSSSCLMTIAHQDFLPRQAVRAHRFDNQVCN